MSTTTSPRTSRSRRPTPPTPDEYSVFVGQLDLLDIWLIEAHIENRHGPRAPHRANIAITSPDPTWGSDPDGFSVKFSYDVSFADGNVVHALFSITFGLRFSSTQPMTEPIFKVFKDVNLPVNTWPFLREFVSTSLGRMGWQAFTLPAYKVGVLDDEDAAEAVKVSTPKRRQRTRTQ